MEKAYRAFKERKAYRWKAFGAFVALLIIEILLVAYITYNVRWFRGYGVMIVFISFLFGFFYLISRSWAKEWFETDIFVDMYDGFKLLELCSNEDEDSLFYSRKAAKKVRHTINKLSSWCNQIDQTLSKLAHEEYIEPLRSLRERLEKRILRRIAQHKDIESMIRVLQRLAGVFSEADRPISLDEINIVNKQLEHYEPIELEESPTRHAFAIIASSKAMKFLVSVFLGYFSITVIIWIFCQFLTFDFVEIMRSNLVGAVSGGAVLSGIIASFFIIKR